MRTDDVGKTAQRLDPVGDRVGRPFRPGSARGSDLGAGVADGSGPDFLAGGRLGRDECFAHSLFGTPGGVPMPRLTGQATASDAMASPRRRTASILHSNGRQSSWSAIAD